ncbi:hypothetical protein GCM10027570_51540 [Streptomonospora sediminis]
MRVRLPRRELLDRPILGGRAFLGSALWAAFLFGMGLVLWHVGAYTPRDGADPRWLLATLALSCVLVVFRRTAPTAVAVAATLVVLADASVGPSWGVLINYGDALYAVSVWGRRRAAYGLLAAVCGVGAVLFVLLVAALVNGAMPGGPLLVVQMLGLYVLIVGSPVISGLSVREHRLRTALERERARQIERMAELDRRSAVAEERGRVARELHDVVANHLSAVAVQSTAALSMRDLDPERVRRILAVIRDSSLHGLTEMRSMIQVLRGSEDNPEAEAVTPRLRDADRLFANAREAGLEVSVAWSGRVRELPANTDAAAYRVLQESLTNALRYADPMRVEVSVDYGDGAGEPDGSDGRGGHGGHGGPGRQEGQGGQDAAGGEQLVLTVRNGVAANGAAGAAEQPARLLDGHGAGAGLAGMRERMLLLGGRFSAGPCAPGPHGARVWQVRAEVPLQPAERPDATGTGTRAGSAGNGNEAGDEDEAAGGDSGADRGAAR